MGIAKLHDNSINGNICTKSPSISLDNAHAQQLDPRKWHIHNRFGICILCVIMVDISVCWVDDVGILKMICGIPPCAVSSNEQRPALMEESMVLKKTVESHVHSPYLLTFHLQFLDAFTLELKGSGLP